MRWAFSNCGELGQGDGLLGKCLLHRPENLSWDPEQLGAMACIWNPNAGGGGDRDP